MIIVTRLYIDIRTGGCYIKSGASRDGADLDVLQSIEIVFWPARALSLSLAKYVAGNANDLSSTILQPGCHDIMLCAAGKGGISMRTLIAGMSLALMLATSMAVAQPAPFNDVGVTMGHWHFASRDVQANKKIFVAMGGTPLTGGNESVQFPGARINLTLGNTPGSGDSVGSVINHVGFIVKSVQEQTAKWKANGVPVLPGANNRLDQAFVVTPDGVRIEILEDKTQTMPIRHEHIHFSLMEAEIPKAQAWYAKTFGGKASTRNNAPVVDIPGGQLRFAKADTKQAPTKGRVLDHIGFDVKDLQAFVKKIQAEGITLDEPIRTQATGVFVGVP
jgi:catechol 2,3-dioxygenase-like lactoylglutathione lyase family enzyme